MVDLTPKKIKFNCQYFFHSNLYIRIIKSSNKNLQKVQIYVKCLKRPIFASQVRSCIYEEHIVSETLGWRRCKGSCIT